MDELAQVKSRRLMLEEIRKYLGDGCRAAEVGVLYGAFSVKIWDVLAPAHLYLIDPWRELGPEYTDYVTKTQVAWDAMYQKVQVKFSGKANVTFLRDLSANAALVIPKGSLDFVYIDANHDYAFVLNDLQMWSTKLRRGGVLAGHDHGPKGFPGVRQATAEFFKDRSYLVTKEPLASFYAVMD